MQTHFVLAAGFLMTGWALADARAVAAQPAAPGPASAVSEPEVPAAKWSTTLLQRCLDRRERDEVALAELTRKTRESPRSVEDLAFPEKERRARAKVLAAEQKRYFARLSFFLLGDRAASLRPGDAGPTQGPDPLQQSLKLLFADATACEMEAFQATLLFAYFNVPFTEERLRAASAQRDGVWDPKDAAEGLEDSSLADEIVLRDVEHGFHNHAIQGAEASYRTFDREKSRQALVYPRDLMRRLKRVASNQVAEERAKQAVAEPKAPAALRDDLERRLRRSDDLPDADRLTREEQELEALLNRMNTYIERAAEPARIRTYVHARTDEFEGALRTSIPEKQVNRLETLIDGSLFPTEAALVILQRQSVNETIARVNAIVDKWFRDDALPSIEKLLFDNPFSAYWFFVQTGGLPRAARPYAGSKLTLSGVEFSLDQVRVQPIAEFISHLLDLRIPGSFSDEYAALEQELRETTVTRQYALEMVAKADLEPAAKARLVQFVQSPQETDTISTIDVYRWIIADSNKVRGSIDRNLVGAGLELMREVKAEQLNAYLERVRQANPTEEGERLAAYLRNAGEMMLELESRQGVDGRFHQGTEAGVVGWLFGGFLFGNTVPIQLWVPGGVNGREFAELMNEISPKNPNSKENYSAKEATRIALVHDGAEHLATAERIIDRAENFVNIAGFDWKRDAGGRRLTYRVMAKKLGIAAADFDEFLERFGQGLPLDRDEKVARFNDIPAPSMKNLLVYQLFDTSTLPDFAVVRQTLRRAGKQFECSSVKTCGDLSPLVEVAGGRYDATRAAGDPAYAAAWEVFRTLQRLFEEREPEWSHTKPRASLAAYLSDGDDVRRFVNRFGLHRSDSPGAPLPVNIIVDGKQSLLMNSSWGLAGDPPYLRDTPINDLYEPLLEFGAQVVLWKGVLEFPWHIGPVPVPGRKVFGKIPMPFIPYPWLAAVPGFGWAGTGMSLFLQFAAATDPRNWWAMVTHVKHFSNEREAMESGLGIGSKYNNDQDGFKTWHDMGVVIEGPIVNDANDYFVWIFNQARKNNSGNAGSKGVRIRQLAYNDYRGEASHNSSGEMRNPSWFITTHPEHANFNYRAALLSALAAAQDNIYLESSFFSDPVVPRMLIRKAREFRARVNCGDVPTVECSELKRQAVQIHLILPGASDKPVLDTVATAEFHEMLHLGVKIYRWDPPSEWSATKMLHTKAWLVDYEPGLGGLAYVGSSNATQQSHILDEEAGIVSTSPAFADDVYTRLFAPDIHRDSRVETAENFHVTRATNPAIRSGRWMRRFLLALFFI
ncbi:MAG: hypothetical protein EHM89_04255 [Acidobacteria bacterium]|nr:MAG: hypothetical protein EHM89_04255 [Acidobacteriota bacterium]